MHTLRINSGRWRLIATICWFCLMTTWLETGAWAGTISQIPLPTAANARPNIMLLLDNSGSMNNVVPDSPFNPETVYLETCPTANLVPTTVVVEIRFFGGRPRISLGGQTSTFGWGAGEGQRCFASTGRYLAKLVADSEGAPSGYLPAEYRGNYLNWYFQADNTTPTWSSGQPKKPGTATRMEIAKGAARTLLDTLDGVRVGLSTYNQGNGASILQGMIDINSGRAGLKDKVDGLQASGSTPLAEALRDLGDYFAQGQNGPLLLHPGSNGPDSVSKSSLFARGYSFNPPTTPPIEYFCQKNFALLMTDGRPTSDADIASVLRDYDGDCLIASPICLDEDRKPGQSYEASGTDFLDDVAAAWREIDLRPDLNDHAGLPVSNNLLTYTIGFADDQVINDPLMLDTAANGGGRFLTAANAAELSAAFASATNFILAASGSAAAAAVNGPRLGDKSVVFQAIYNSGNWTGDLKAYNLDPNSGQISSLKWEAADRLPPVSARRLFSWNPVSGQGITLEWSKLSESQRQALSVGPNGVGDGLGEKRLAYLRGETSGELRLGGGFRNRINLLGDIVNSDPVHVGNLNYGYDRLPGSEGTSYAAFRAGQAKNRPQMIYAGANDGFLHGFSADTGEELFAYMPAAILPQVNQLTFPSYSHRFFVDGPPRVVDAFLGGGWKTILLGTPGAGGRGLFALDITDPGTFTSQRVLWEIESPDLGHILGSATLARLAGGRWVALTGNGYGSDGQRAMLLVYDLQTGALLKRFDTGAGPANGLSAPVPVDLNDDRIADLVYAGDLLGNLWKFDLSSSDPGNWSIAFGGKPLFIARDGDGRLQPITSRPAVGRHPKSGVMVYFGTGKYFEVGDNDPSKNLGIESFYGIRDLGTAVSRSDLVKQSIIGESVVAGQGIRTTTQLEVGGERGWYLDLAFPAGTRQGERVVSSPLLRHGRVIFPSIIPSAVPCGSGGESWLMELDAISGGRLQYSAFDIDRDGKLDDNDFVAINDDEGAVSGIRRDILIDTPGVTEGQTRDFEIKYVGGADGRLEAIIEPTDPNLHSGRHSWRQLQ